MRVNQRIRVPEIRVVMDDGEQKGIMPTRQALALAHELGLDLVEISPRSHPPVCRIMDYGKYKYEQSKKKKAASKHASRVELKEIKFRPKTEGHDMDFKIKHVRRFIEEGNKCRLVIIFRGREITHPETGLAVLNKVVTATEDIANVEVRPNMEGRRMVMILAPRAGVIRRARQTKPPAKSKPEKDNTDAKDDTDDTDDTAATGADAGADADADADADATSEARDSGSDQGESPAPSSSQ